MKLNFDARRRGISYSIIALGIMAWAIAWAFFSFDIGLLQVSWGAITGSGAPFQFRLLGIVTIVMFTGVILLSLHRGVKMWRAESWKTGSRIICGAELKLEATVVLGLGITVFVFVAKGFF